MIMRREALHYCAAMANLPPHSGKIIHFTDRAYASTVVVEFPKYSREVYMTTERLEVVCNRFKKKYSMRLRGKDWRFYGRIDAQRYVIIQVPTRGGLRIALFQFNQETSHVPTPA